MIAATIASLALAAGAPAQPTYLLAPTAACHLAKQDRIQLGSAYVLEGTYFGGVHGATLEIPKCDAGILPSLEGDALEMVKRYHIVFSEKCGGPLIGEHIVGRFTGRFERRKVWLHMQPAPIRTDVFVITRIDSESLDPAGITCPK